MNTAPGFFHADDATRQRLADPAPRVLLAGSYGGFSNFGDVLQLKGALRWHRARTRLEPVLVCHAAAVTDGQFCDRLRNWYGVRDLLFWSPHPLDMSAVGMRCIEQPARIDHLHVYGGGFLNRYWGRGSIETIEGLIEQFGVGHYVLSGQQVDAPFVPELRGHFERYRPVLAGGRDPESARLLADCGVDAGDSFDDAIELLRDWVAQTPPTGRESFDLLIHLNLSYYTGDLCLSSLTGHLAKLAAHLDRDKSGRHPRVALLHAYNDRRIYEVCDTLGVVQELENAFPFARFEVIQLGQMALELGTVQTHPPAAFTAPLAFASSYHVSILCALLGIPCFLWARNDYYTQKRDGLSLGGDFDAFLRRPEAARLDQRLAVRERWLGRLDAAYAQTPAPRSPVRAAPPGPPQSWSPKAGLSGVARLHAELQRGAEDWRRQQAYIAELHEAKAWLEGQVSAWQRQAGIHEQTLQELRAYIATLENARVWLDDQRRGWEATAQRLEKELIESRKRIVELERNGKAPERPLETHDTRAGR